MMLFTTLMMTVALAGTTGQQPAAPDHAMPAANARPATLMPGIQGVTFPISTRRAEAQQFFNQALAFVYAFNHDEAIRSFRRATTDLQDQLELDENVKRPLNELKSALRDDPAPAVAPTPPPAATAPRAPVDAVSPPATKKD